MERMNCPVCGRKITISYGTDLWGDFGPLVLFHTVPGVRWTPCRAVKLRPEEARAVGRILTEGGERFCLAAHP